MANEVISVSGLNFFDINNNISWRKRLGAPDLLFGLDRYANTAPPVFRYLSEETVSSFKFVKIDTLQNIIEEISLDTSLLSSDGTYHTCDGTTSYTINYLHPALGYFEVNGQYESDIICLIDIENRGIGYDIIDTTLIVY